MLLLIGLYKYADQVWKYDHILVSLINNYALIHDTCNAMYSMYICNNLSNRTIAISTYNQTIGM